MADCRRQAWIDTPARRTGLLTSVATAAIASLALGVGVASAHTMSFPSEVTIDWTDQDTTLDDRPDFFSGTVNSPRSACQPNRRVQVFRKVGGPDELVGAGLTNPSEANTWRVIAEDPGDGTYYANVKRKDIGPAGHDHVCRADRSPDIPVIDQES